MRRMRGGGPSCRYEKRQEEEDAMHMVRRVAEHGEQPQMQTRMVLLDWESTFDEISREALNNAMLEMTFPRNKELFHGNQKKSPRT